jgi:4-amino-4-deoxy-L-arabinose transferase-like glycosyltransferase
MNDSERTARDGRVWEWHRDWFPAVILSACAILLRIVVAAQREGIEIDGITYLQNARALATSWWAFDVLHPPLYSLLLAPILSFWHDAEWGARVTSAVLGGLWVWPTLWLARETTEESVPWTAGLLVAVTPAAVEASTRVLSEATFGLCLTLFFVGLVYSLRTGSAMAVAYTGVCGGLATLARPEGMGYLILAGCLLVLARVGFGTLWTKRRVLTRLAILVLCWLAVLAPYMVLIRAQTGQWHWSGKAGISLLFAESVGEEQQGSFGERHLAEVTEADIPKSVLGYVIDQPGMVLRRIVINLHLLDKYTLPALLASGGLALVVLGLAHLQVRRSLRPEWLLLTLPLPLAGFLLYLLNTRYFVALIPVVSIVAGIGLARFNRPPGPHGARRLPTVSLLLFVVVLMSYAPYLVRPWFREDPYAIEKTAGLWLRHAAGSGTHFVGSYAVLGYYAEAHAVVFGTRSLESLLATGHQLGARFFIADNFRLPESRPDLLTLAAGSQRPHRDLELVETIEDRAGRRILIYRIL